MKLSVEKENILNAISIVQRAVSGKTTLPILECMLLTADADSFTLTANDLELGIESAPITANIIKTGAVAIDARLFSDIVRRLPNALIHIEKVDHLVHITCEQSNFTLVAMEATEFPSLPEVEKDRKIQLSSHQLKNMIRQVIFSVSQDERRPVLTGISFEAADGILRLMATDAFRYSYRELPIVDADLSLSIIIPGKTLEEISRIVPSDDEDQLITLYIAENHILFELPGAMVVSRLLEGEFIDYESLSVQDSTTTIYIDKNHLLDGLERSTLLSRSAKKSPVILKMEGSTLELSSQTEFGTSREVISVQLDGSSLEIGFNPRYLIDALKVIDEDELYIQFTSPVSPCTIRSNENTSFFYLISSLRISNMG